MLNRFIAGCRVMITAACAILVLVSCTALPERTSTLPVQLASRYDEDASQRLNAWLAFRDNLREQPALSELEKVERTNDFINTLAWRSDQDNWGQEDYWATPLETLLLGSGDCEDLAMAKYFTLLDAGVDEQRLRLSYVWHWQNGEREAHLVLAYYPELDSEALILDNLDKRTRVLSERVDLEKVYSFNRWDLWLAGDALQPVSIASQDKLTHWRQVNERMLSESQQFVAAIY